jgi:hypothetical protein
MVNTRKYKKTKGGWLWPFSKSPQPVQEDQNDCTVIANKSIADIGEIVDKEKLEKLVVQRNECRNSNTSLEFTVDDTYIAGIIAKKKQQLEEQRVAAGKRRAEDAAQQQLADAEKRIKQARTNEDKTATEEYTKCRDETKGMDPSTCPGHEIYSHLYRRGNVGGNRRTKRKHKKCKKAKSKRRSIKRRMNK